MGADLYAASRARASPEGRRWPCFPRGGETRELGDPAAALNGNWLVVTPPAEPLTGVLRRHGGMVTVVHAAGARREEFAGILSDAGLSGVAVVVSLLALQEQDMPGCPGVSVGTAATVQALGDAAGLRAVVDANLGGGIDC